MAKASTPTTATTSTTTTLSQRDENGLIRGLEYKRLPNGRIDWRAMIPAQHVKFNDKFADEITKKYGGAPASLSYGEVIKTHVVEDKHIIVLLAGFVELADIRGFTSCLPDVKFVNDRNVTCQTIVKWLPNFETDNLEVTTGGVADATFENTGGWSYLATIAENRAFVRAVRRFLRINILGADEIAKKDSAMQEAGESSSTPSHPVGTPTATLINAANEAGCSFEKVKEGATTKYRDKITGDPTLWASFEDVAPRDAMTMITLLKAAKKGAVK